MIDTTEITKMVKHIVRRDNGIPDSNIMHPMREWGIGILVTAIAVVGGVIFNIFLYQTYTAALTTVVPVQETAVPYQAANVAAAIEWYTKQAKTYQQIIGTRTPPVSLATSTSATSTREVEIISATTTKKIDEILSVPTPVPTGDATDVNDIPQLSP